MSRRRFPLDCGETGCSGVPSPIPESCEAVEDVGEFEEEGSGWHMYSAIARMRSCRSRETYFNPLVPRAQVSLRQSGRRALRASRSVACAPDVESEYP